MLYSRYYLSVIKLCTENCPFLHLIRDGQHLNDYQKLRRPIYLVLKLTTLMTYRIKIVKLSYKYLHFELIFILQQLKLDFFVDLDLRDRFRTIKLIVERRVPQIKFVQPTFYFHFL